MNWSDLAHKLIPGLELLLTIAYPPAAAVLPLLNDAITVAQSIHGSTNQAAKKQIVYDAISANNLIDKKVQIDPAIALRVTDAVFTIIDGTHATITANTPSQPVGVQQPASAAPEAAL